MNVLFLTGALYTTGETRVALSLAQELQDHGDTVAFVSSPLSAELVRDHAFRQLVLGQDKADNRSLFRSWCQSVAPDVIVLADYYLFMTQDLESIFSLDDLASLTIPILTLDNVGLSPDEQVLSWLPLQAAYVVKPPPDFIRAIVRPCPPHDPSVPRERTVYAKVYREPQVLADEERVHVRKNLGCGCEDRLIFYALPQWAYRLASRIPWLYTYYAFLGEIFGRYFNHLDRRAHFAFLAPRELIPAPGGDGRVHWLKSSPGRKLISEQTYHALVLSADLFITDSILSATLGLALFGLIPSISLMNRVTVADREPAGVDAPFALTPWAAELISRMHRLAPGSIFPFAWFPLGLLEEIDRLHAGSAFLQAVARCELFDEVNTAEAIRSLLFDEQRRADVRAAQRAYVEQVCALPDFPQLLRQIV